MIVSSSDLCLMHLTLKNNDEISMQAPFKDFDHCTVVLCDYMTGVQRLVHHVCHCLRGTAENTGHGGQ